MVPSISHSSASNEMGFCSKLLLHGIAMQVTNDCNFQRPITCIPKLIPSLCCLFCGGLGVSGHSLARFSLPCRPCTESISNPFLVPAWYFWVGHGKMAVSCQIVIPN